MRTLTNTKPIYILPNDPYVGEVLIPAFNLADKVNCMVGYFTSSVFSTLAPGLATFIAETNETFRLIISPILCKEDMEAIEKGVKSKENVATELISPFLMTEDWISKHTLKCLTYLLKSGRLDIRIALMKDAQFHMKVWIFQSGDDMLAVHGSSNATSAGVEKNYEQVMICKNWVDSTQNEATQHLMNLFEQIWENNDPNCLVIPIPAAIEENLIETYDSGTPPREQDLQPYLDKLCDRPMKIDHTEIIPERKNSFNIPDNLEFEAGPFEHQGLAVNAWCNANFSGVLEMATGSGKTITSMICAHRLFQIHSPLLIIVAAPYVPLIKQWCEEIKAFGLNPSNLSDFTGSKKRLGEIKRIKRLLDTGLSRVEVVVVSHDTLCDHEFLDSIQILNCSKLLIADEVHNLGRPAFINNLPTFFEYKLALSATPVRQYDQEGTRILLDFFGDSVFKYSMDEAIGNCLVSYDYFAHQVQLNPEEMDRWYEITAKIRKNSWRIKNDSPDEVLAKLYRDRRIILETAENKIHALKRELEKDEPLKYTLIYATDKEPNQLKSVNKILREMGFSFHQLTANETRNPEEMQKIIQSFKNGDIQILTAKRVLDEGVNIPQISRAYVLASTTVERQWIQRRGRLLRTCAEIKKISSNIHDFVVFPPNMKEGIDRDAKALLKSEFTRIKEFWRLSRNSGSSDGALNTIQTISDTIHLDNN